MGREIIPKLAQELKFFGRSETADLGGEGDIHVENCAWDFILGKEV